MKSLKILIFMMIISLLVPCTVYGMSFTDITQEHWAYKDVMTMAKKGVITGTSNVNGVGTYEPDGKVTLGQFLAIATRLVAPEYIENNEGVHWAEKNYNAAINSGLIKDGDFEKTAQSLDSGIKREDMAYILVNIAKKNGETLKSISGLEKNIKDLNSVSKNRQEAVILSYSNGLITGKDNGLFKPDDLLTRAEIATVFCRVMNYTKRPEVTVKEENNEPKNGEIYIDGDYKYTYFSKDGGWSVTATDKSKKTYGKILEEIKSYPVVSLDKTFENCTELVTPPQIPQNAKKLYATFQGCTSLTDLSEYIIPYGVEDMHCAFKGCESLKYAPKIPDSVTNMYGTFMTCRALLEAPKLSANTQNISHAFAECDILTTPPEITSKVTNMSYTFWYSPNVRVTPELPDGLIDMSYAFSYTAITEAPIIPDSVKIMKNAFASCAKLEKFPEGFKIPYGVTDLRRTFGYCYKITTIPEIPETVTDMEGTFLYCTSLQGDIVINATPEKYDACFDGTMKNIYLTGKGASLSEMAQTSKRGNVSKKQ